MISIISGHDISFVERAQSVQSEQFHRITKALADPRRFEILQTIASCEEAACSDLRLRFPISAATLSHHIKELATAGLIEIRRKAKFMHIKLRRQVWKAYVNKLAKL